MAIELLETSLKTEKLSNALKGILWNNLGNNYLLSSAGNLMKLEVYDKTQKSFEVGKEISKRALEKKIESVVFDIGGYRYHGRVKAVADGAREGGLKL